MRAVVQRVHSADVRVQQRTCGSIGSGMTALVGVHRTDSGSDADWMADKLVHLRIFDDERGMMNRSLLDTGGELLLVSQFTLLGDCRRGRRPSWSSAMEPEPARLLFTRLVDACRSFGVTCATGIFQAHMEVQLINAGPVTLLLDSQKTF